CSRSDSGFLATLASIECYRGFMALEKIMRPSFHGRSSDRTILARLFKAGTMSLSSPALKRRAKFKPRYRGAGAAPVLAKISKHLVNNVLLTNSLGVFFYICRRAFFVSSGTI